MNAVFIELKKLIDYIQSIYSKVTVEWLETAENVVSLKTALVRDVDADSVIYQNIMSYVQLLSERDIDFILNFSTVCAYPVTTRIKTANSIEYKIQNYRTQKHQYGKIPVNKCINDLFGIRVIVDKSLTYEDVSDFIKQTYSDKYKCIDSSKQEYKAIHIYFKEGNKAFPWELQIWNTCDAESNFASHKKYKQEYTTWETESEKGGIIDG